MYTPEHLQFVVNYTIFVKIINKIMNYFGKFWKFIYSLVIARYKKKM